MMITKAMLLNDVRKADTELFNEGYTSQEDRDDALADIQGIIMVVSHSDYDSEDDYEDGKEDFWADGTEQAYFVKRDSVLCTALMNYYAPQGTVRDFDKVAKKNIYGYYSQMIPDSADDEEGFWFVAGSDLMDSLVPYSKQKEFMASMNK